MQSKGFTLVELMVSIAIAVIIITIAIPSFTNFLRNSTVRTQANELAAVMQFARSEAIKRRTDIDVAVDNDGGMFIDVTQVTDNQLLRTLSHRNRPVTVSVPATVRYNSRGLLPAAQCFELTHNASAAFTRHINVSLTGIPTVNTGGCV